MQFSEKVYVRLKFFTQVVLPALGALYAALAALWGLPKSQEVSGTILALVTFLGICLQVSSSSYNSMNGHVMAGDMVAVPTEHGVRWQLEFDGDPATLGEAREVHFKVKPYEAGTPGPPAKPPRKTRRPQ